MKKLVFSFLISIPVFCLAQGSLNVSLLYHWEDTTIPVSIAFGNAYNDVWGFTQNGREYAVIGSSLGAHFFDITDPANASQVDFVPGAVQGPTIVHRDYHDYKNYLYMVCDEGPSTLQIVDLRYLPDSVHLVYDSDALFNVSHNIFIDSATAKMYACGGANQLAVYSLADPTNPTEIVNCLNVSFWPSTVGYVHDIYVRNDTAYCNAGNNGLWVVDFSDTEHPQLLGSFSQYLQSGYNHSGWLNKAGDYYALADETHGLDVKLVDVTDLQDMQVVDTFGTNIDPLSIPHNVIFKGDYLYVSYYHDGFYIFNTCNPHNVTIAGFYDTSTEPHATNYKGAWGVYPLLPSGNVLVSDMQNGLFVFDVSEALINIEHTTADPSCYGSNDGSASVEIENGTGNYSYSWSNGLQYDENFQNQLPAGNYVVTITDTNDCTYESAFTLYQPSKLNISLQISNATVYGGNDGYASGNKEYELFWSTGATGDTVLGLSSGWYSVTATDSNGCGADTAFFVSEPVGIRDFHTQDIVLYPHPFSNCIHLLIPDFNTGDFCQLTDISGRVILKASIRGTKTTLNIPNDMAKGIYILKVSVAGKEGFYKLIRE